MTGAKAWRLLFLGFGNVGRELARLLLARRGWLSTHGLSFPVTGILTRSRGLWADPEGLDLAEALERASSPAGFPVTAPAPAPAPTSTLVRDFPADIVVEMTPLRVDLRGEPAISNARAALESGRHVVSANKGPVAWAYRDLEALAGAAGRRFLFESTVMDGTPVFSLARRTLAGCRFIRCRGILNSTTNFVLGRMAEGLPLAEAVKEAQAGGFAETDPSLDLEGWDATVKLTCLANVLMDLDLAPEQVDRTGITAIAPEDLSRAARHGRVMKLVAEVGPHEPPDVASPAPDSDLAGAGRAATTRARVRPEALPVDDVLALVGGTSSAVTLTTDLMGEITVFEHSPTVGQTAYGVYRDLLEIAGLG